MRDADEAPGLVARSRTLLRRAFLPEQDGLNCAVIRLLFGAYLVRHLVWIRPFWSNLARSTGDRPFRPSGAAHLLSAPIAPALHDGLYITMLVLAILVTVGLLHRWASPLLALLMIFLFSYRNSFGFIYHTHQLMVVHAIALALAPASDRISVDAILRKILGERGVLGLVLGRRVAEGPHWRYGWPVQTGLFLTGVTYWIAGIAKLDNGGGLHWATDAVLLEHIANNAFRYIFLIGQTNEWTAFLYSIDPRFVGTLAMGSLCLELGAPAMILDRRLTLLFGVAFFCFHWSIKSIMGITFPYQLSGAAFIFFVPWDLCWRRVRQMAANLKKVPDPAATVPRPHRPTRLGPPGALCITALLALILASPGLRMIVSTEPVKDDFLLSNYAMFSKPRAEKHRIFWVRATGATERKTALVPFYRFADGGMNSALSQLRRARKSKKKKKRICTRAARSIAQESKYDEHTHVELITDWYRPEVYFGEGDHEPAKRRIGYRCRIPRD